MLLTIRHVVAQPARSPVHLHMRMHNSVHLSARAHPGLSCDFVNQLARERLVSCLAASFAMHWLPREDA